VFVFGAESNFVYWKFGMLYFNVLEEGKREAIGLLQRFLPNQEENKA